VTGSAITVRYAGTHAVAFKASKRVCAAVVYNTVIGWSDASQRSRKITWYIATILSGKASA